MRKLYCFSFREFDKIVEEWNNKIPNNIAIISIINSPKLIEGNERHLISGYNVLNLDFDDITEYDDIIPYTIMFNRNMAIKSYEFINDRIKKGYDFYIHCSAGMSRSQAFVRFIENNWNDIKWETRIENPCVYPNLYVLSLLNKVYREQHINDINTD